MSALPRRISADELEVYGYVVEDSNPARAKHSRHSSWRNLCVRCGDWCAQVTDVGEGPHCKPCFTKALRAGHFD